jgi:battenin
MPLSKVLTIGVHSCLFTGYVIMLSGAHDMLNRFNPNLSTGWVLLADILPTFIIKLIAPWFLQPLSYTSRVLACIAFAMLSFLLVRRSYYPSSSAFI